MIRCLWITCWMISAVNAQTDAPNDPSTNAQEAEITWKQIPSDILRAQKQVWLFPAKVARGRHIVPTLLVLGSTAGLVALDPTEAGYYRDNSSFYHGLNHRLSGTTTTAGVLAIPAAFYLTGLVRKDTYLKNTAVLAAEAVLDVEIPNLVLRNTTRRLRPLDVPPGGNFSNTWFKTTGNPLTAKGSFPSGHSAAAFAVATVFAKRYSEHRWVPFVAYGVAALVGFSRVSSNSHFLSDVGFGSMLGFSISHWVVLRR
jgi:membrane-associated phospholipid phosphatase